MAAVHSEGPVFAGALVVLLNGLAVGLAGDAAKGRRMVVTKIIEVNL